MAEKLKIISLGGLNEIGKNLTVYEYGSDIIVVDAGMGFPDDDMYGIDDPGHLHHPRPRGPHRRHPLPDAGHRRAHLRHPYVRRPHPAQAGGAPPGQ